MSNEIQKYQAPQSEKLEMAKLFAESKMFDGIASMAAAFVKIQAGAEIGLSPFSSMSGIHIIKGKVSIGAGLMAGCVKGSGKYDYVVKKMEPTVCSIDFLQAGKVIGNSTFTIEDAKKANTQNLDKFPRNMLFARAMSNGVKWFAPDVFTMPVYTPEEMGDANFTEDIPHQDVPTQTAPAATGPVKVMEDAIIEAKKILLACTTVEALGKAYKKFSPELQKEVAKLTTELKAKLSAPATQAEVVIITPIAGGAIVEPLQTIANA